MTKVSMIVCNNTHAILNVNGFQIRLRYATQYKTRIEARRAGLNEAETHALVQQCGLVAFRNLSVTDDTLLAVQNFMLDWYEKNAVDGIRVFHTRRECRRVYAPAPGILHRLLNGLRFRH